jgi:predicted Na+-dependent transporter
VVLPVAIGQLLRGYGPVRSVMSSPDNRPRVKLLTESILVGIIYTTFCQSFARGLGLGVRSYQYHIITLSVSI